MFTNQHVLSYNINKMNKILIIAISLLSSFLTFSQDIKIENGTYSEANSGENLNLIVQDGKFHISIISVDFLMKKDSIITTELKKEKSGFTLNYSYDDKLENEKIRITLINNFFDINTLYIGTQNGTSEPHFKNFSKIKEELITNNKPVNENNELIFEIDKSEFITIVMEDLYTEQSEVAKFKLPVNINNISINYRKIFPENLNLKGIYNEKTKEITLTDKGRDPLTFKFNKELKEESIQPLETYVSKNWTYPGKEKKIIEDQKYEADSAVVSYEQTPETKVYKFAHFKSNNFKQSLNRISKTPSKFLVVSFDLKNKKSKVEFDEFIKNSEVSLSEYMYYEYNKSYDNFDYYLATEKDKNLLSKYKIKSDSEILVFNSQGDLLYHTSGNLASKSNYFGNYDSAYFEFEKVNQQLEFDKILLNTKASDKEILNVLKKPYPFDLRKDFDVNEISTVQPSTDSTAVETPSYEADNYYDIIKDRKNLYKLKSTYILVNQKWEKIVSQFKKSNIYNKDYLLVVKQELNNEGFSKISFTQDNSTARTIDLEMLDYVFANYKKINKEAAIEEVAEAKKSETGVETDYATTATSAIVQPYMLNINTVLENYFNRVVNGVYLENQEKIQEKTMNYYRKYIELQEYKSSVVKNYMTALVYKLDKAENKKEYFDIFDIYFNKVMLPNKSIIENLDIDFTANSDIESNWTYYKNNFANDCNQVAWEVVKSGKSNPYFSKAIKWSEMSLEIQKDIHYYCDTLARLYYLNGQKEKAFNMQQKAIELGKDSENIAEYKSVLEQMKNGTYTLPVEE